VSYVEQDLDPILARTHNLRINGDIGGSDMKHAASIPNVLIEKYCNENGITFNEWMRDPSHIKRMLNDPQNEPFRIWKGRV
jgi:hypothetical protein